jgi:hypothetical protein
MILKYRSKKRGEARLDVHQDLILDDLEVGRLAEGLPEHPVHVVVPGEEHHLHDGGQMGLGSIAEVQGVDLQKVLFLERIVLLLEHIVLCPGRGPAPW